jgi:hypothetical protein
VTRTGCASESAHRARVAVNYDETDRTVLGRSPQDPGRFAGGGDIIAASPGCPEPSSPVNGAAAAAWCLRQLPRAHDRDGTCIIKAAGNRAPDHAALRFPAALATGGRVPWWGIISAGGGAVLVAMNPEHAGGSLAHGLWAAATFTALIAWPVGAWRRGTSVPWGLRPAVSAAGVGALLALLAWYLAELTAKGAMTGLAERAMCAALVGWPLTVVLSCRRLQQRRLTLATRAVLIASKPIRVSAVQSRHDAHS